MNAKRKHREEMLAWADLQVATTRCAFCPWKFRGPVCMGKKLFRLHVRHEHRVAA